jgi:hypothetical protein
MSAACGGGEKNQGEEAAGKISEAISSMMQPLPRPLFYMRGRRSSQHANAKRQEKRLRPGSDHDLKLKSISCEPSTEEFAVDEDEDEDEGEDEDEDEDEKEEQEEEEDEEEEEDSMENEEKEFAEHRHIWESRFGKGFFEVSSE